MMIILLTQSLYRSSMVDLGTLSLVSYAFPELGVNHFLFPVPRKKNQNQPSYHRQIENHLLQLNLDYYLLFSLILDKLNEIIENYCMFCICLLVYISYNMVHIKWIVYIYIIKLSTFNINWKVLLSSLRVEKSFNWIGNEMV